MKFTSSTVVEPDEAASLLRCVNCFGDEMKRKLMKKLKSGRSGWDSEEWTPDQILKALKDHIEKGDMVDVANFAMFLWNRDDFPHTKLHAKDSK